MRNDGATIMHEGAVDAIHRELARPIVGRDVGNRPRDCAALPTQTLDIGQAHQHRAFCAMCLALLVRRPTRFVDVFRASFLLPMTVSIALTSIIWSIMLDPTLGPVNGFLR